MADPARVIDELRADLESLLDDPASLRAYVAALVQRASDGVDAQAETKASATARERLAEVRLAIEDSSGLAGYLRSGLAEGLRQAEPDPTAEFSLIPLTEVKGAAYSPEAVPRSELLSRTLFARADGRHAKLRVAVDGERLRVVSAAVYSGDGLLARLVEDVEVAAGEELVLEGEGMGGAIRLEWGKADDEQALAVHGGEIARRPGFDDVTFADVAARTYADAEAIPGWALRHQVVYVRTPQGTHAKVILDAGKALRIVRCEAYDSSGKQAATAEGVDIPAEQGFDLDTGDLVLGGGHIGCRWNEQGLPDLVLMSGSVICFETLERYRTYENLIARPELREAMIFENARGAVPYARWTPEQQSQLREFIYLRDTDMPWPMTGPPALQNDRVFGESAAWQIYLAHVAQSLWAEAHTRTPWRLAGNRDDLLHLFDSRRLLRYYSDGSYEFSQMVMGLVTAWNPRLAYDFLSRELGLGHNRSSTIRRLVDWCRTNLEHIIGIPGPDAYERIYGYRGPPLVERMIHPLPGQRRITAGCWGTDGFMAAVLRTVNIPLRHGRSAFENGVHSRAEFVANDMYLAHGDDPYTLWIKEGHNTVPIERIFMSGEEVRTLIDRPTPRPGLSQAETAGYNHNRRFIDLAVEYKTDYLLALRCAERSRGDSRFRVYLRDFFTDAELDTLRADCDRAIAAIPGGCAAIRYGA